MKAVARVRIVAAQRFEDDEWFLQRDGMVNDRTALDSERPRM
jgi:hypothetical protein